MGGGTEPDREVYFRMAEEAWHVHGRPGRPRLVATANFVLRPEAVEQGRANIGSYYRTLGARADGRDLQVLASPEEVHDTVQALADIGVDEVMFYPSVPDLEEIDRLAEQVR